MSSVGLVSEERALLARIAQRDEQALAAFYDLFSRDAFRCAKAVTLDPGKSEEAVQEAFVDVFHRAAEFDERRGSPRAWFLTMVVNRARMQVREESRRHERQRRSAALWERSMPPDPLATLENDEQHALYQTALGVVHGMPERYRVPLLMCYRDEVDVADVATILGASPNTIRSRLRRGLRHLRDAMRAQGRTASLAAIMAVLMQAEEAPPSSIWAGIRASLENGASQAPVAPTQQASPASAVLPSLVAAAALTAAGCLLWAVLGAEASSDDLPRHDVLAEHATASSHAASEEVLASAAGSAAQVERGGNQAAGELLFEQQGLRGLRALRAAAGPRHEEGRLTVDLPAAGDEHGLLRELAEGGLEIAAPEQTPVFLLLDWDGDDANLDVLTLRFRLRRAGHTEQAEQADRADAAEPTSQPVLPLALRRPTALGPPVDRLVDAFEADAYARSMEALMRGESLSFRYELQEVQGPDGVRTRVQQFVDDAPVMRYWFDAAVEGIVPLTVQGITVELRGLSLQRSRAL